MSDAWLELNFTRIRGGQTEVFAVEIPEQAERDSGLLERILTWATAYENRYRWKPERTI